MYFYTNVDKNDYMNGDRVLYLWTKDDESYSETDVKVYVDRFNLEWYDESRTYTEAKYKYLKYIKE